MKIKQVTADGQVKNLIQDLAHRIQPELEKGEYIDFVVLKGDLLHYVQELVPPIYQTS